MDRREFLAKAGLAATWAAISVRISGCASDEGNPLGGGNDGVDGDVTFDAGHRHSVFISDAAIAAGNAVTLTLSNSSGHSHQVTLSAQQVMDIGEGTQVVAISTNDDGHTHVVSFN